MPHVQSVRHAPGQAVSAAPSQTSVGRLTAPSPQIGAMVVVVVGAAVVLVEDDVVVVEEVGGAVVLEVLLDVELDVDVLLVEVVGAAVDEVLVVLEVVTVVDEVVLEVVVVGAGTQLQSTRQPPAHAVASAPSHSSLA